MTLEEILEGCVGVRKIDGMRYSKVVKAQKISKTLVQLEIRYEHDKDTVYYKDVNFSREVVCFEIENIDKHSKALAVIYGSIMAFNIEEYIEAISSIRS